MKKLLLLSVFLLNGCALTDAYFMAKYDTNEYSLINQIKTKAFLAQETCYDSNLSKAKVNDLFVTTTEFRNFTFHIPRNQDATKMAEKLVLLVGESKDLYNKTDKVSEIYCKAKFQQIVRSADQAQSTLGAKPR
jgi:hypothetical protein